jgi:Bacterial TSP3 repeat
MNLRRLIVATASLSLALAGMHGGALAQIKDAPIITGNVDGSCVTRPSVTNTGANAGDWTITCGDLNPGAGMTVISPSTAASEPAPIVAPEPAPEPARAPVSEPAPVAEPAPETAETAPVETAVATESDLDADNYTDALEVDLGLDPTSADTDVDGVADGDEILLYSTEPTLFDTDGDGVSDGEELFGIGTDPVVWNDFSTDASTESLAQEAAPAPAPSAAPQQEVVTQGQETTENLSATNGDAASLGTGNASSAPGTVTRDGVTVPSGSVLGPDGSYKVTENSPPTVSVSGTMSAPPVIVPAPGNDLAPAPVVETVETAEPVAAEPAPVETSAPVAADTAVASPEDADADNYLDAAELEVGLDPGDPDTDDDGVADGDEAAIYGTDAFTADSDGDGVSDGGELFDIRSDPLVWDTNGNGVSDGEEIPA